MGGQEISLSEWVGRKYLYLNGWAGNILIWMGGQAISSSEKMIRKYLHINGCAVNYLHINGWARNIFIGNNDSEISPYKWVGWEYTHLNGWPEHIFVRNLWFGSAVDGGKQNRLLSLKHFHEENFKFPVTGRTSGSPRSRWPARAAPQFLTPTSGRVITVTITNVVFLCHNFALPENDSAKGKVWNF